MMDNAYQNSSNIKNYGVCNNLKNNDSEYNESNYNNIQEFKANINVTDTKGENESSSNDSGNIEYNKDVKSPNRQSVSDGYNSTDESETECEYKILPSYISNNSGKSETNNLSNSYSNKKCEFYLPPYIKWNADNNTFCYMSDQSAEVVWEEAQSLREAEHRSGYRKKQWVECPLYKIHGKGFKYVPRSDTDLMKSYLSTYYPGHIKLKDNEKLEDISRVWVFDDGYYSYRIDSKKKNLERNCTDGLSCKLAKSGKCPYNHYVEGGVSRNMCEADKDSDVTMCMRLECPCDHKVNRVATCSFFNNATDLVQSGKIMFDKNTCIAIQNICNSRKNLLGKNNLCSFQSIELNNDIDFTESERSFSEIESIYSDSDNVSEITTNEYNDYMDMDIDDEIEIDPCYYTRLVRPDNINLQLIDQETIDDIIIKSSMANVAPFSPVSFNVSPLDYGVRV